MLVMTVRLKEVAVAVVAKIQQSFKIKLKC